MGEKYLTNLEQNLQKYESSKFHNLLRHNLITEPIFLLNKNA